ncbi:hypothetical protein SAMN05216382_2683 [Sphingomonas palmae]|uniref:FAD dependent oxidoreductase n=1 Tax=Sphingomonas palmae TaxID=1855283 RepID=A0A1H7T7T9_9SPHN|nr:hypothetical protein [Sphingomonas palmae]SEL80424.1 hypothetical protein SAMN05216382_2683 [Sphingomonas palmae]
MTQSDLPEPDLDSSRSLDRVADKMLKEAVSASDDRIFSASGFARQNISIVHQQLRCVNLVWALERRKRVKAGDVVAVVGGSFSGLMLAVALSLTTQAEVYLFEKDDRLLPRYRDKGHRHLSPVLNSNFLGSSFEPSLSSPAFKSPIFSWSKGRASDVAAQWLREFAIYERDLPIRCLLDCEVLPENVRRCGDKLELVAVSGITSSVPVAVDLLIDATGFGEEANPFSLVDHSYWSSGHRLIYDHLVPPAKVLLSGCGDSGVIEGMHYAMADFDHKDVEDLWPSYDYLGLSLDQRLEEARLPDLTGNGGTDRSDRPIISELAWWLELRFHGEFNSRGDWPLDNQPHTRPILSKIEAALRPHAAAAFPASSLEDLSEVERDRLVEGLALEAQLTIREAVTKEIDYWVSLRIAEAARDIIVPNDGADLHAVARQGISLTLNGMTPTPFTRQLSNYNVWLMRLLEGFPGVDYRQGGIVDVRTRDDRRFDVEFDDGQVETFDRVVTRYGARIDAGMCAGAARDGSAGDWLLHQPCYLGRADGMSGRVVYPARERLERARQLSFPEFRTAELEELRRNMFAVGLLRGIALDAEGS